MKEILLKLVEQLEVLNNGAQPYYGGAGVGEKLAEIKAELEALPDQVAAVAPVTEPVYFNPNN